jgi:beta-phosphoglucomutase
MVYIIGIVMEKGKKIVAALFDFDGVVMDTETQYSIFWGRIGNKYHPEIEDFKQKIKGSTLFQIYNNYFRDKNELQKQITEQLNIFESQMPYNYIPGVERFLCSLREEGIKTAVVTSSNNKKMANVYSVHPEMKSYFDKIFTADMFTKSKPDPQCYLLGANTFGATPDECVVFEDSYSGLEAGRAAKMNVVALATTNPRSSLISLSDVVIDDFQGINLHALLC